MTIVIVTHDQDVAARAGRMVIMHSGCLIQPAGTPAG
jgi:predicted ABC-type transport system involved in lysophospholipase L1 biosynthesis ATPase subunit